METDLDLERYSRQLRFAGLGAEGQRQITRARVTVCGCGALGTAIANGLVRAGFGFVRIIDRDFIELNNLQRQTLFDEEDIARHLPKAIAAAEKLRRINSSVTIDPVVTDLDPSNIASLCGDVDLILDGTDNFETRYLINDFAVKTSRPWIFGSCLGSEGQSMTILPEQTPCLRCVLEEPPAAGTSETCETAGILGTASAIVAAISVAEGMKVVTGAFDPTDPRLVSIDVWKGRFRTLSLAGLREKTDCPTCKQGCFEWLEGKRGNHTTRLCGRNAVQIVPAERAALQWDQLQRRLTALTTVEGNRFLLRFSLDGYEFSVFPDGRAIIKGTDDIPTARALYARYLGG